MSRGSNWAVFKSCNVSAMLGEVPAFGNVHQICHEHPKSVSLKTIHSIYPVMMELEAQGSRMLGDAVPLCCTFIERGCPAI